jgi:hypothetical protein
LVMSRRSLELTRRRTGRWTCVSVSGEEVALLLVYDQTQGRASDRTHRRVSPVVLTYADISHVVWRAEEEKDRTLA